jgi:hypothetical protein
VQIILAVEVAAEQAEQADLVTVKLVAQLEELDVSGEDLIMQVAEQAEVKQVVALAA